MLCTLLPTTPIDHSCIDYMLSIHAINVGVPAINTGGRHEWLVGVYVALMIIVWLVVL